MYAVFQIGCKQYRVLIGQIIYIDRINVDIGKQFEFNQVLFVRDNDVVKIGNPFVNGSKVIAKVLDHCLGKKIKIIKFRRRKHFLKCQGHRQCMSKMYIVSICTNNLQ